MVNFCCLQAFPCITLSGSTVLRNIYDPPCSEATRYVNWLRRHSGLRDYILVAYRVCCTMRFVLSHRVLGIAPTVVLNPDSEGVRYYGALYCL